jgi:hypothetical protein
MKYSPISTLNLQSVPQLLSLKALLKAQGQRKEKERKSKTPLGI